MIKCSCKKSIKILEIFWTHVKKIDITSKYFEPTSKYFEPTTKDFGSTKARTQETHVEIYWTHEGTRPTGFCTLKIYGCLICGYLKCGSRHEAPCLKRDYTVSSISIKDKTGKNLSTFCCVTAPKDRLEVVPVYKEKKMNVNKHLFPR